MAFFKNKEIDLDKIVDPEAAVVEDKNLKNSPLGKMLHWTGIAFAFCMSCFQVYTAVFGIFEGLLQRSIHMGLALGILFCVKPPTLKFLKKHQCILGVVFCALSVVCVGWILLDYDRISMRWPLASPLETIDYFTAICFIILLLEGTRKVMGPALPIVAIIFIVYAFVGPYLPGILVHRGYSITAVVDELFLTTEGIWSGAAAASATFLFMFILFGSFLESTKVGDVILQFAYGLTGGYRGGPAKCAVVSSGLMGMVSGSGIAVVATTGTFTIPLMKKLGYEPKTAGGIEAAAACGGQIMPPVMGASAFLMAEFTGTPYTEIIKIAFIPGIMYFLMVLFQVHFRAHSMKIPAIPREERPDVLDVLKSGWYAFIPLVVLIVLLVSGRTPMYAAIISILCSIVVSFFDKQTRLTPKKFFFTMVQGAKAAMPIALACGCAGIVVGICTLTGLGMKFSSMLVQLAQGSLILAIFYVAVAAFIMGMGLPVVAAYVILAVLGAPALSTLGVPILAAHLMVMWFTQVANLTPPVCLAAYAAAGIAQADPMETGWASVRYGLGFFFIPLLFVYSNLLQPDFTFEFLQVVITAVLGILFLASALEGYFFSNFSWPERFAMGGAGGMMIYPSFTVSIFGGCIAAVLVGFQLFRARQTGKTVF
jgi:TRAP transporter 4TM/12TM fusion protein